MRRGSLFLLLGTAAFAQAPQPDPFDQAMQAVHEARGRGNPSEAASQRERARHFLELAAPTSPGWAGRVQSLAQVYQGSGWRAEARTVVQEGLSRANVVAEWSPVRVQLLNALAEFWQQDGNLLKALAYREKAVAAMEASPPTTSSGTAQPVSAGVGASLQGNARGVLILGNSRALSRVGPGNNSFLYQELADLNRQLGRPEAAAQAVAKMRALLKDDAQALASSYERDGDLEHARALLQKAAAEAAANPQAQPWEIGNPLQQVASLYEREKRPADAVATLQQAAAYLDASSQPQARDQAAAIRLRLAGVLREAGQRQASDEMYQALLSPSTTEHTEQQIQVVLQYANHLSQTDRRDQGSQLLKDYLANHPDLQPWQESNLLFTLAQIARQAGQKDLADQYQRAADEKQRGPQMQTDNQQVLGQKLQQAETAANRGDIEEAMTRTLDAITSASFLPDGDQIAWRIPELAGILANKKAPDKAEQVYRALFLALEARSVDDVGPVHRALEQYVHFLMPQKDRRGDAALAIDRYRERLIAAHGAETSAMVQVEQLRIQLARAQAANGDAVQHAEAVLALEESLSGATSAPYLRALQTAAEVYRMSGSADRALALHRQIVAIADLAFPPNDALRGFVRMNAAMAFATSRRFDEAERLAEQAVSVGESLRPPRAEIFRSQAEQIQRMKAAGEAHPAAAPNGISIPGISVSGVARP